MRAAITYALGRIGFTPLSPRPNAPHNSRIAWQVVETVMDTGLFVRCEGATKSA